LLHAHTQEISNRLVTSTPNEFAAAESAAPSACCHIGAVPAWLAAVLLVVPIGATYFHSLQVPFIFDDVVGVEKNESLYSLWPLIGSINHRGPLNPAPDTPLSGRPLVSLSFALNHAIGGDSPATYHALNVLIHFLSAMLLWAIVKRTLRLPYFKNQYEPSASWLALATALIWALHPLQSEAIVYITQRTELMMAMFYLATLYCSLRYWSSLPLPSGEGRGEGFFSSPTLRATWLSLAFCACLCGMASKEVMVSAPIMMLLFDRTFVSGSLAKALRRSWPLYAALASTWLLLLALNISTPRGITAGFGHGPPLITWWMTQSQMLLMYFKLVVWPWPLLIHYQLPYLETFGSAWPYVLPVVLLGLATLVLLWRNEPLGYLGFWVFAILAPTSLVPVLTEMGAERRMYLPLAAFVSWFVVAGHVLVRKLIKFIIPNSSEPHNAIVPLSLCLAPLLGVSLILGLFSSIRVSAYLDELSLWDDVLHFQPENYVAHIGRGLLLAQSGRKSEAVDEIQMAARAKPDHPVALNNLGLAFKKTGQDEQAIESLQSALKLEPDYKEALLNLAGTLADIGRFPEAIENLRHALRLHPEDAVAHNNLANTLARAGRPAEAIVEFQAALALNDDDSHVHSNMASALTQIGRFQEAIDHCHKALRLCPDCFDAHHNLGTALLHAGRFPEAVAELRAAVAVNPDEPTALNTLGAALLQVGAYQEAAEQIRHALRIRPDYAVAHNNLGQALARTGQVPQAYDEFRRAIESDSHFVSAHVSWALVLSSQGEFVEASRHLEKAIALGNDQSDIHNLLGDCYRKSGSMEKAIEQYRAAVRQKPDYMAAHANLAQTLALVHRSKEAVEAADKAIEIARSKAKLEELAQFEEWLKHYRIELQRAAEAASTDSPGPSGEAKKSK
jgi:protein O-mannosyl-transferase